MTRSIFLFLLILIIETKAVPGEVNKTSESILKAEFNCTPPEDWKLLKHRSRVLRNMCIKNDYEVEIEPRGENLSHILMRFFETRITNVDELKKTITVHLVLFSIWEDPRITARFTQDILPIKLPSFTAEEQSLLWTPFQALNIAELQDRKNLLDPNLMERIRLSNNIQARPRWFTNMFTPNLTLVMSRIEWSVTVSCSFDFSNFPFDINTCPFKIKTYLINIGLYNYSDNSPTKQSMEYDAEGFTIKMQPFLKNVSNAMRKGVDFGLNLELKRETKKYFFQYFLPSMSVVIATSFNFIIPLSAIPGRVALVVTQFLTLTNIFMYQIVSIKVTLHPKNVINYYFAYRTA